MRNGNTSRPSGTCAIPLPRHPVRVAILDLLAIEQYLPLATVQRTGRRLEQGRLAGAVGTEHSDDLPFVDLQADAANGHDRTVIGLDISHLQQAASSFAPSVRRDRPAVLPRSRAPRRRTNRQQTAVIDRHDPVGDLANESHVVFDHDQRDAKIMLDVLEPE